MLAKRDNGFVSLFDEHTGLYLRTEILNNGIDTGIEAFMASFPELLDVGIMGHCVHGLSGLCLSSGVQCYQRGDCINDANMSLEDFRWIVEQCRGKTFQIALGGRGDPDQHEHFTDILELCRKNTIVPNFTTSGFGMTEDLASHCARYCGAVAVSWYRSPYTNRSIELLVRAGVKTNIHYVLMKDTLREAVERLKERDFPKGINAVVFLLHKPVGLGKTEQIVRYDNPLFEELLRMVDKERFPFRIGFDSCSTPALIRELRNVELSSIDACEGARWSAYISPDMKMLPCSFGCQTSQWEVDLRQCSIMDAWRSEKFDAFRQAMRDACPTCSLRERCMGGCHICPEVILCANKM